MKKKMLFCAVLLISGAVYLGAKTVRLDSSSSLLMQNVTALASGESGGGVSLCYDVVTPRMGYAVIYCYNCSLLHNMQGVGTPHSSSCY